MPAYYNEFKPEAAHMLRQLIKDGLIADGEVDERSITEVKADEIRGFTQVHLFAGIGGWPVAFRKAGWPDERPVWSGSYPCQPFSSAGKQKGGADDRHLWPVGFELKKQCNPSMFYGEQVASAISHGWIDRVFSDMEGEGYACAAAILPACSVNAPHKRDRLWYVANASGRRLGEPREGKIQQQGGAETISRGPLGDSMCIGRDARRKNDSRHDGSQPDATGEQLMAYTDKNGCGETGKYNTTSRSHGIDGDGIGSLADRVGQRLQGQRGYVTDHGPQGRQEQTGYDTSLGFWSDYQWIVCGDGKIRRIPTVESGVCVVAHGLQHRAPLLHAFGNAIVHEVAARFIKATM